MGYFTSLDEYTGSQLLEEITSRTKIRDQGLCDYCFRPTWTPPCKFPVRHSTQERKCCADYVPLGKCGCNHAPCAHDKQ